MGKLSKTAELPKVLLIGDTNDHILQSLLINESLPLRQKNEIILDTKYYTARVKLESLKTKEEIHQWSVSTLNKDVGAVIYNYDGEFRSPEQLRTHMLAWQAEIRVAVCKRLEGSAEWSEDLRRLCASEGIELIELDPDEETVEELKECCELYGISRIRQVLEAGNWDGKIMKKNPLGLGKQCSCAQKSMSSARSAKESSENPFEDEECGSGDMTEEDVEMILKLFGGPKVSFECLMKDVDSPDPSVIEYFRQETEKLKRQNKTTAKKRRKKKSKANAVNEFGELVGAGSSTQTSSNAVTQNSSNVSSPSNGLMDAGTNYQENGVKNAAEESNGNKSNDSLGRLRENSRELSDVARSLIDGLFGANIAEQGAGKEMTNLAGKIDKIRSALSKMPFGPDRQNLAADAMEDVIKSLGAEDLFSGSSDDEKSSEF